MTQLQKMALEHVDELLIDAHNVAKQITDVKGIELIKGEEIGYIESRGDNLASDLHKIQMWCRVICNDPQS